MVITKLFWSLRSNYKDSTSNFEELLLKSDKMSVHQRNLQLFLAEIYKTVSNLSPCCIAEVSVTKDVSNNICGSSNLVLPKARTNFYGIDTVRLVGQTLWLTLLQEIKRSKH